MAACRAGRRDGPVGSRRPEEELLDVGGDVGRDQSRADRWGTPGCGWGDERRHRAGTRTGASRRRAALVASFLERAGRGVGVGCRLVPTRSRIDGQVLGVDPGWSVRRVRCTRALPSCCRWAWVAAVTLAKKAADPRCCTGPGRAAAGVLSRAQRRVEVGQPAGAARRGRPRSRAARPWRGRTAG